MRKTGLLLASTITASLLACDGKTLSLEGDALLSRGATPAGGGQTGGISGNASAAGTSSGGAGASSSVSAGGGGSGSGGSSGSGGASGSGGVSGSGGSSGSGGTAGIYCDPGEYAVAEGTRSEFVCTQCLEGSFNSDPEAEWCTTCQTCGSLKVVSACTSTTDTQCEHIGGGWPTQRALAPWLARMTVGDRPNSLAIDKAGTPWLVGQTFDNQGKSQSSFLRSLPLDRSAPKLERFGTGGSDISVTIDPSGTIWIAGTTEDDLGGTTQGGRDAYVRRYPPGDTDRFGTSSDEQIGGIATDALGNVWVAGDTDGDLSAVSHGQYDYFLREYPVGGRPPATQLFGGPSLDQAVGVAVDGAGNVWVLGETYVEALTTWDATVSKFPAAGGPPTTEQFGSPQNESPTGITVDLAGNVWVVGYTNGALARSVQGPYDAFVRKYPADGSAPITEQIGTPGTDFAIGVATDKAGNVWVVGGTDCELADDPLDRPLDLRGDCGVQGPSLGYRDNLVREYPADGSPPHTYQFGMMDDDGLIAVTPGIDYGVWALSAKTVWHLSP